MDRLTDEEVLHIADLGKINLNEDEVLDYSYKLKALLNEIDKINNVDIDFDKEDIFIAPEGISCEMSSDCAVSIENTEGFVMNAPKKFDKFIEVVGVFDE